MIRKIISGGQTGDRMALDWAIWHDIPRGGWLPRRVENPKTVGSPPNTFSSRRRVQTTFQRTEWNAHDSDGSVVFSIAPAFDWRLKEDRRFRDQTQEAVASHLS